MLKRKDIRDVAIIAHVDHGKTTLVDTMFKQSGMFRDNQQTTERAMDSNDLERERGITILSKNTSVIYDGVRINIVDTPGHADFGGEVERVLSMVSGAIVLVDAAEGPMPQTRFVLSKAMALSLPLIIVVNKADKPDADCARAVDDTLMLLMELGGDDEQLDSPVIYASGRDGISGLTPDTMADGLEPLLKSIIEHIPCPVGNADAPFRMQVSTIDHSNYVGRISIGRVDRGTIKIGDSVIICNPTDGKVSQMSTKITSIMMFEGLSKIPVESASIGDIVAISGIDSINIGDTICSPDAMEPMPVLKVSEPTVAMTFSVNNGPLAGKEGDMVTSRHIAARLEREAKADVALRIEPTESTDSFRVCGRGELHLSILVETMRREGYEFMVSKPNIIVRIDDEGKKEPIEHLVIDSPEEHSGTILSKLNLRKATMLDMHPKDGRVRLEFHIASRALFGFRDELLTNTKGEAIMSSVFDHYGQWMGDIPRTRPGVLVATEQGKSTSYALNTAQKRGQLFIGAGEQVYEGMIVGLCPKPEDVNVNVCREKKLTNMRASGKDDSIILSSPRYMSLEEKLLFIEDDELLEVTPKSLRLRKKILNKEKRLSAESKAK
ncbi:MAG: translational GTPase TypA [Eubacteriales bacterium]